MRIKAKVRAIGQAFVHGLRQILANKLYGLYVYGAVAFPEDVLTGDIDFHVILTNQLTNDQRSRIEKLHHALARDFPPLGGDMDGYYILLADARRTSPPQSQMWSRATDASWALHREHIRAGRCIIFHGPDPKEIYLPAAWLEIKQALKSEFQYVVDHLDQYPDWCILQLCRLIYSHRSQDAVVSKAQASDWAYDVLSEWRKHIEQARKSYFYRQVTPEESRFLLAEARNFLEFACVQIEQARQKPSQPDETSGADKGH